MQVSERGSIISHQLVESRISGGEAHRITIVGSTVADLAGSDHPHHVLTACNGGYRGPASQGFCVACDVRFDSVEFLGSAWCDPESCEYLVEDEENFVFEDLVATSEGSCDANCLHCRLRARVGEADHLRTRHSGLDLLGYLQFQLGSGAKHRPVLQLPVYRLEDRRMRVAEDDRAVA